MGKEKRGFNRHASTTPGWTVVPHVSSHMYFEISPGCECLATHSAFERLVSSMSPGVYLQSTC